MIRSRAARQFTAMLTESIRRDPRPFGGTIGRGTAFQIPGWRQAGLLRRRTRVGWALLRAAPAFQVLDRSSASWTAMNPRKASFAVRCGSPPRARASAHLPGLCRPLGMGFEMAVTSSGAQAASRHPYPLHRPLASEPDMKLSILAFAFSSLVTVSRAQDAIVPDQFPTIQSALFAATDVDGDGTIEIFVRNGTYAENLLIQRSGLSLTGESAGGVVVQGTGGINTIRVQNANHVTISTLTVRNNMTSDGIEIQRSNAGTVSGVIVTNCLDGITVNNTIGGSIVGNECFANAHTGIKLGRSTQISISTNNCHNNTGHGIDIARSVANTLTLNACTANGDAGIRLGRSNQNTVDHNTCTLNLSNGLRMETAVNNTVSQNTLSQNVEDGLRMVLTTTNVITGNTITNNGAFGVRRKDWNADDFSAATGTQDAIGDNTVTGNVQGALRND
jgi:parallel beta-helix repeat protein